MHIVGIDPAIQTGWSLLEVENNNIRLREFGTISIPTTFNLSQKLNFIAIEIRKLMLKYKPDYCAIEDLILGLSGVKILVFLSRLNGVIIQAAYDTLKDNVRIYTPGEWKKNSFPNLNGTAQKWEVQYAVCKYFNLVSQTEYDTWTKMTADTQIKFQENQLNLKNKQLEIYELKKVLVRKKLPDGSNIDELKNRLESCTLQYIDLKKEVKDSKKFFDKELQKVGNDIHAKTMISSDIADSIGLAVCLAKDLKLING